MASPSKVIWQTHQAYEDKWQIICNEGGSRSGKSYSTIQILVSIATTEANKRISVVSHSLPRVKRDRQLV
jgi:phage terminase large subunit